MTRKVLILLYSSFLVVLSSTTFSAESKPAQRDHPLHFIYTAFENASPLNWTIQDDESVLIELIYDHERSSPNRANGHWLFQVQGEKGSDIVLYMKNFYNVWNGRMSSPISERTHIYLLDDSREWRVVPAEKTEDNLVKINLHMNSEKIIVARMEPYRLRDLRNLIRDIEDHPLVHVSNIGETVEGRHLEIIRVGKTDAPHRVFLRARAHPWEAGGNWVVQGLIRRLLQDDEQAKRYLDRFAVYIMPMANKDGVARGYTRFNVLGMDLNRKWDKPADPKLCPENHALEKWLERMIENGQKPDLAIDMHNDNSGKIHVSRPDSPHVEEYLKNMERYEALLRKHTWFTEGSTGKNFRNPGSIGEGMLTRFGIDALVQELNCDWIAGLEKEPFGRDWEQFGAGLCEVFYHYFEE